jgi:hypothetical protein
MLCLDSQVFQPWSSLSEELVVMAGAVSGLYSCARPEVMDVQKSTKN